MNKYCSVSQYAEYTGKDPGNIRKMLKEGRLQGEKIGNQWVIMKDTLYPDDRRVKSGSYRNWRKSQVIRSREPELMRFLHEMSVHLSTIYGNSLEKIVLYGSYARGDYSKESDVDIALFLNRESSQEMHDQMVDLVVDYELKQGLTLSVIPIDLKQYLEWNKILPFYKNVEKEGIVLWKTT